MSAAGSPPRRGSRCAKAARTCGSSTACTPRTATQVRYARSSSVSPSAARRTEASSRCPAGDAQREAGLSSKRAMARQPSVNASGSANHRTTSRRGICDGAGREQRGGGETGHGGHGEPQPAQRLRDAPSVALGHGEPGAHQPVRQRAHRLRGRRRLPHRRYGRLPVRPDGPYHRALHVVPPARIDDGGPAGVGEQQPPLTGHRDEREVGDPAGPARQEGRLVQRQLPAPSRVVAAGRRLTHRRTTQPQPGDPGDRPGQKQKRYPEHGLFVRGTVAKTPCLVHDPDAMCRSVARIRPRRAARGRRRARTAW